jgi:hypothetical protein
MKVGDLVRIKRVFPYPTRRHMGIVVRDFTMWRCLWVDKTERVGELEILWNDGTTANAAWANLEVLNGSR